ncbi:uncharacterized protein N7483_002702 [Penicillium malachiteum]|uniref:uncharacterized protein n=1 Tax=Penicillium malachiteum TaxID=1324776 RepID=UPI002547DB9A|nr:uncharacterized protein N7483_002702 [Penicillium malachiteum]KAJ5737577.1 hypothetical protein N7483_002702 [Penicillium malachiteum]
MTWPWLFVYLDSSQKQSRREVLAQFAFISQVSILIPIAIYQLYRIAAWILSKRINCDVAYTALEGSSATKSVVRSSGIARRWRSVQWWLNGEIASGWGLRKRWIAAILWFSWLLFLSIFKTGNDYFHLTKRFGSVAAAQLPFHYLLSLRTRFSPLIILFGTSHEELIKWHRVSGNIIMILLLIHGSLYLNYYILSSSLIEHLQRLSTITGLIAVTLGAILTGTSLDRIRELSYRVFFLCHLAIGMGLLPILFLHARPLQWFTTESLALFILDRVLRRFDRVTGPVTVSQISHTDILKIEIPIKPSKMKRFQNKPAQHVYVSLPSNKKSNFSKRLLSNPFTVASVSSNHITLVLRAREGPTTQSLWAHARHFHSKPVISVEGPYGRPVNIRDLSRFDHILLVAGGIGATFTWPIYWALQEQIEAEGQDLEKLKFIWAVRSTAEASWVTDSEEEVFAEESNIHIYVTRHQNMEQSFEQDLELSDEGIEMDDRLASPRSIGGITPLIGRPYLKDIVNQTFDIHADERVAVLFCGPKGMGQELRGHVDRWAVGGRDIFWHEERFGM